MYFLLLDPVDQFVNYLPSCLKEQELVINYVAVAGKSVTSLCSYLVIFTHFSFFTHLF